MEMDGYWIIDKIKTSSSLTEIFKNMTPSTCGFIYEKLWDIIIKFGFCDKFPNNEYDHYEGNINIGIVSKVINYEQYLFKKINSNGGAGDIILRHKLNNTWIFISVKFYDNDSKKHINDYDVGDIIAAASENKIVFGDNYKIYIIVKNGNAVDKVINTCHSTNNYLKNKITCILDVKNLMNYVRKFKAIIVNVSNKQINTMFSNQLQLQLRFHQELISNQMMQRILANDKKMLLGAKARSGKTYCIGGLFKKFYKNFNKLNALIITPAPNETISQFTNDLFHKYSDFTDINILEIRHGSDFNQIFQDNNIIIVSKQLLDGYVKDKTIKNIKTLKFDFIVFDENHFHGTTQMSKNIFKSYSSENTVLIYITATFIKPLNEWKIPENCQFYWSILDENLCKKRDINGLIEQHGQDVISILGDDSDNILSQYDSMPELHIITNMMDYDRYLVIKNKIKDTTYGFSNTALFSLRNKHTFNYIGEIDIVLSFISGGVDVVRDEKAIFERIKKISGTYCSRTNLNNGDFTTQLWFLPFGKDMYLDDISVCLKERMLKNAIFKKYEILIVNSKREFVVKDIKKIISNAEFKAKESGKYGLIILAGNQLTLGITLPMVDIVILLNDILSSDKIIQMMYRCMTEKIESDHVKFLNQGEKKLGFVVDMNISRVINTMLNYHVSKSMTFGIEDKISYIIQNNLIHIDEDLFHSEFHKTDLTNKILNIWKSDPINNFKTCFKQIEDNIIEIDFTDQSQLNKYFTQNVDKTIKMSISIGNNEPLQTGVVMNSLEISESLDISENPDSPKKHVEIYDISITKDILPFIGPLCCILTVGSNKYNFLDMINMIKLDRNLLDIFEDQSFIWWKQRNIIEIVEYIVAKYVKRDSMINDVMIQFKLSLESLLDNPKDLLELIDNCLKPKQKEKQENGEVFTPMSIVFELIDQLDLEYNEETGRSIFSEKDFKWFDPANGMGNFPIAVYMRLMEGLCLEYPDVELRKKHIIENMLYMSELNKKNVFICHQIFNQHGKYKMNLHEGDTLKLNIKTKWNIDNFDVIIGNPPYNKGGIRSHTGKQLSKTIGVKSETIWTKFVEKSLIWLKPNGFLVFINPLSWLKKSHSLHTMMLGFYIKWLKLWDNSNSKNIINADIPISLYILQNTYNQQATKITSILKRRNINTSCMEILRKEYSIPLACHSIFNKLISFISINNLSLEYHNKTIKSDGKKFKLPQSYDINDLLSIDTYTHKEGILVKKSSELHPDADKRKIIIANKSSFSGIFIDDGKLGITGTDKFYIIGSQLELVLKTLKFKICDMICHLTKYRQDFIEKEVFTYIPDLRKLNIDDINEDEFYEMIELTSDEINIIKNIY